VSYQHKFQLYKDFVYKVSKELEQHEVDSSHLPYDSLYYSIKMQLQQIRQQETNIIRPAVQFLDQEVVEEQRRRSETLDFCFTILDIHSANYSELKQKLMDYVLKVQKASESLKQMQQHESILTELKRVLNVRQNSEITTACSKNVEHLQRYLELFPKLHATIDEICKVLNVQRLEQVVPTVKRLMLLTKSVNQWITDNTIDQTLVGFEEDTDIFQDQSIMEDILRMQLYNHHHHHHNQSGMN
jgi:hypothetical protein